MNMLFLSKYWCCRLLLSRQRWVISGPEGQRSSLLNFVCFRFLPLAFSHPLSPSQQLTSNSGGERELQAHQERTAFIENSSLLQQNLVAGPPTTYVLESGRKVVYNFAINNMFLTKKKKLNLHVTEIILIKSPKSWLKF